MSSYKTNEQYEREWRKKLFMHRDVYEAWQKKMDEDPWITAEPETNKEWADALKDHPRVLESLKKGAQEDTSATWKPSSVLFLL
jgi:hypothetical protein